MTSPQPAPERSPTGAPGGAAARSATAGIPSAPCPGPEVGQPPPANSLTPEEQMALFEKELKENDWGHQPC